MWLCDCVTVWQCDCVTVWLCDNVTVCGSVDVCVTVCGCVAMWQWMRVDESGCVCLWQWMRVDEKERAIWLFCMMWQKDKRVMGDERRMMRDDEYWVMRSDEKWWMSDRWVVGEWWKSQKRNSSTRGSQVVTYPSTRLAWGGLTSRSGTRSGANRLVWPELLTYPLSTSYTSHPHPPTHTQQTHHSRPILTHQCTKTPKNTKKHTIFKKYPQNLFWPSLVLSIISIISVILMRGYHTHTLSHSHTLLMHSGCVYQSGCVYHSGHHTHPSNSPCELTTRETQSGHWWPFWWSWGECPDGHWGHFMVIGWSWPLGEKS